MNTSEFLNITALIVPERPAIVFDSKTITYEKLVERVNRLADVLQNAGVSSGDRVATIQVNCNEHIEAYFASAQLDAVYVPINFRSTADEIEYMISDSAAKAVIAGERYIELVDKMVIKYNSNDMLFQWAHTISGHTHSLNYNDAMATRNRWLCQCCVGKIPHVSFLRICAPHSDYS